MKKTICMLLAVLLCLSTAFALAEETPDHLARVLEAGKLIAATEGNWAPWTYHDVETGELIGFDVEITRLVAAKLGVEAEFVECPWESIFAGIDAGRYDLAANGVEYTEERAEKYAFSTPYGYIRTALVVHKDNEDIKSFEDLAGKKTANSIASTYMTLAESYGAEAVGVSTLDLTIENVLYKRADATLNAEVSIYDYLSVHPDAAIKIVALTDEASQVVFPLYSPEDRPDDSATLLAAINQALEELAAEGELSRISEKYFGSDITKPTVE